MSSREALDRHIQWLALPDGQVSPRPATFRACHVDHHSREDAGAFGGFASELLQPILVTFLLLGGGFGFGTQGLHLFPTIVARSQKTSLRMPDLD